MTLDRLDALEIRIRDLITQNRIIQIWCHYATTENHVAVVGLRTVGLIPGVAVAECFGRSIGRTLYVHFEVVADVARTWRCRNTGVEIFRRHYLVQGVRVAQHLGIEVETLHAQTQAKNHLVEGEFILDKGSLVQGTQRSHGEVADIVFVAAGELLS